MRLLLPRVLGVALILHGLAQAVLPLRGAGVLGGDPWVNALSTACYVVAIIGFVAAGVAALGVRLFERHAWWLALAAATSSMVGLRMIDALDLWPGMLLNLLLAVAASFVEVRRRATRADRAGVRRLAHAAGQAAGIAFVAYVAAAAMLWPWHRYWGTTPAERAMALPGDAGDRHAAFEVMHAVSIDAPPDAVWPWLVQIGQDRAGFYSYDWLERAFLADIRNVDEIRSEWQERAAGDFVRAAQPGYLGGLLGDDVGWYVAEVQRGRALVLHAWGAFVLLDDGAGGTRLIVRSTFGHPRIPAWAAAVSFAAFELPHFIMERRMLLGIKERAERRGPQT